MFSTALTCNFLPIFAPNKLDEPMFTVAELNGTIRKFKWNVFFVLICVFWPLVFVFAFDFSMISMVFPKCASFSRWFLSICHRFSSIFDVVHRFPIVFIFQHCSSILSCLASIFP